MQQADFQFSLQHVKSLEITTPILTSRKKMEHTENQQLLDLSEN